MLGLQGKTAFVFGVASEDSIAWAICKQLAAAGVTLYLGYQKRFMSRVFQLKDQLPAIGGFYLLDVASDATTKEFFTAFEAEHPGKKADILIHAIGFAPRSCFDRPILFVEDDDINTAMTISANSLQRCLKHALPYLNPGSSTVTLTYAASTRFVPSYGIMSMAKAALECWTRNWHATLAPRVTASTPFHRAQSGPSPPAASPALIESLTTWRRMHRYGETSIKTMLRVRPLARKSLGVRCNGAMHPR